jgi:alanyl-tRNA synthetase
MSSPYPQERWVDCDEVRRVFVDFFVSKHQHTHVPSSPVVPHNDPTLLFINAGMNQFKSIFLGQLSPNHPFYGMRRAANSQKCIRAGGKTTLETSGKDVKLHSFRVEKHSFRVG